jgi:hypothetical protein
MLAHADTNYWITWFPGAILAGLGVLALFWKGIVNITEATRTLKAARLALPKIEAQFSNNGGSSMKDQMDALHRKVDILSYDTGKWQRQHARDDDRRFAKQEATMERIEDKLTP